MVVRPEMVDPDNFEVTVARNRGLMGNVFDSEKDALAVAFRSCCSIRADSLPRACPCPCDVARLVVRLSQDLFNSELVSGSACAPAGVPAAVRRCRPPP